MVEVIKEMGNPFMDLLRLYTRDIVDPAVASSICCAEEKGIEQFKKFVADRLVERSTPISEPIKKNNCYSVNLLLQNSIQVYKFSP